MVAAGHPVTAEAGAAVLREGGNAVDAVVGALLASCAAEPLLSGLGSGGYLLAAGFEAEPALLDFFVAAPGYGAAPGVTAGEGTPVLVDFGDATQLFRVGAPSVGTWGMPAGLQAALARWGSVSLGALCGPAAALAREGVALNAAQGYVSQILEAILTHTPETAAVFAPGGRALREGDRFAWPALGDALERFGADGAAPFHTGEVAEAAVAWLADRGGTLTRADLAAYAAVAREPVRADYHGRIVLTNPPPSAGGTLIALALGLLVKGEPTPARLVDAMEAAQGARTSEFVAGLDEVGFLERFFASRLGSTTHVSAVDAQGRACAATVTNGEGCGIVIPGTGLHPNNIMGEADLNPLGFGAFPAGRRMPSMMAPTIVLGPGDERPVELVLGSAGSNRIRSAIVQVILGVVDHRRDAGAAVDAPRLHFEDGTVFAEPGAALDGLGDGRTISTFRDRNLFFGGVNAVARDARTGVLTGAGDPRRGGAAVGT